MKNYKDEYKLWLSSDSYDEDTKSELKKIENDENEIEERFYKDLEFGTGGMRGIMGAGTNRMNVYTIRRATQGFANYINAIGSGEKSIVIAYDSRNNSKLYCDESAAVMAANGITAYIYDCEHATPELSFAVRHHSASAGIVITASHNPPEYNGYKIYGSDGSQLVPDLANIVIDEINKISTQELVKTVDKNQAVKSGKIVVLGCDTDDAYYENVIETLINTNIIKGNETKIVYTPLHGVGGRPVKTLCSRLGFKGLVEVKEQMEPDGNFPTVAYPNPEEDAAFACAVKYAKESKALIIVANDPDTDRVGVMARCSDGEYKKLTGNQLGALLLDYIVNKTKEMPINPVMINTIVTSDFGDEIAKKHGVEVIKTLTGFKYIGEKIKEFEEDALAGKKKKSYIFGYEESYGYLKGTYARDKDAVVATGLVLEMALTYDKAGSSVLQRLDELYSEFGYYIEDLIAIKKEGKKGMEEIALIMKSLDKLDLNEISGKNIIKRINYLTDETGLPKENAYKFILEGGTWFAVRPSGTEPKLKVYVAVKEKTEQLAKKLLNSLKDDIMVKVVK